MMKLKKESYPGLLITFCGLDGSGKTTMIDFLNAYLVERGYETVLTKQPTDAVRQSEIFRTFMENPDNSAYDYRSLSLLAASDRLQHSNKVILPALKEGKIVISDRYFYCCLVNLLARGYEQDQWIYEIGSHIPAPDLPIFLDVDCLTSLRRIRSRPEEKERWVDKKFQFRLREEYLNVAEQSDGIIIPSTGDDETTWKMIKPLIDAKLTNQGRGKWP